MFSLERCREILGVSDLDDLELQHLRDQLYGLAEVSPMRSRISRLITAARAKIANRITRMGSRRRCES